MPRLPWWPKPPTREFVEAVIEAASTTADRWKTKPPEPVITILPDPAEALVTPATPLEIELVPEVEVRNLRVAELQHVARAFLDLGLPIESNVTPPAVFNEEEPETNLSVYCAYATMVRASGREANINAVLAKFSALEATGMTALDSFDALVDEHDFATKSSALIDGRTLVQVARGEATMLLTLAPDDADFAQTVLVVGVRQGADRELELLIANSFPPFVVKGTTDVVSPNLVWARASDVAEQCVSENPSTESVRIYELNRDLGIEITPVIETPFVTENEEKALITKLKRAAGLYGATRSRPYSERVPSIGAYYQDAGEEREERMSRLDLVCALANLGRAAGASLSKAEMRAASRMFSPTETSYPASAISEAVERLGMGRRITLDDIGVNTIRSIEVGGVALVVTLYTDPLDNSSRLDTAVVLGARSNYVAKPELFIVVSDPETHITGVVETISQFQMWVDADALLDQCVFGVPGRDGIQAYELYEQDYVIRGS